MECYLARGGLVVPSFSVYEYMCICIVYVYLYVSYVCYVCACVSV